MFWGMLTDNLDARFLVENLANIALAIGALGTAAYGIVDSAKLFPWFDLAGFEHLFSGWSSGEGRRWPGQVRSGLNSLLPALRAAYGEEAMDLLKAQYRSGRSSGSLPRTLRQGVRVGLDVLPEEEIGDIAQALGLTREVAMTAASGISKKLWVDGSPDGKGSFNEQPPGDRSAMLRLITLVDARIDSSLGLAEEAYVAQAKCFATFVAIGIAAFVGGLMHMPIHAVIVVGVGAVPLAPVAKDLATALQQAAKAFGSR